MTRRQAPVGARGRTAPRGRGKHARMIGEPCRAFSELGQERRFGRRDQVSAQAVADDDDGAVHGGTPVDGARQLPRISISRRYVGRCKIAGSERAHLFEHARGRPVTTPGPAPTEPRGALALLMSRRFGPLFATQFLSAFNDNAVRNALVLMIAYSGDIDALSAQILIPLAGGLFMLPFFLCSATAGQLADARDKAWLIRWIKLLEIPVMRAAAAGVLADSTAILLALLLAMGIQAAFFGPLKYAILPDLLALDELLLGNALVEAGTFLAILLGPLAGVLIATRHGAVVVAALIVIVALAAWTASLAIQKTGAAAPDAGARWNLVP